jgi:hypothetical protein
MTFRIATLQKIRVPLISCCLMPFAGWGGRTRTSEWRNQKSPGHVDFTAHLLPTEGQSAHGASKGYERIPNSRINRKAEPTNDARWCGARRTTGRSFQRVPESTRHKEGSERWRNIGRRGRPSTRTIRRFQQVGHRRPSHSRRSAFPALRVRRGRRRQQRRAAFRIAHMRWLSARAAAAHRSVKMVPEESAT